MKEIPDATDDMVNMDEKLMGKFTKSQAQVAYKVLSRAVLPTYSGSVDHRVNLLNKQKVFAILDVDPKQQREFRFSPEQVGLMKELRQLTQNLYNRRLLHGFWDALSNSTGNMPDAREGACMVAHNSNLYVFGGFSHSLFNDIKVFSMQENHWSHIKPQHNN